MSTGKAAGRAPARQRGAALLLIFLIIMLAGLGMLLGKLSHNNAANEREQLTSAALEQARAALVGFAATYADSHAATLQVNGFLPCPDLDNDGSADTCGQKDYTVVGRLPWRTLGLPPLRDGDGECLWYAVSGSFKNNPKADLLDWDSSGKLRVVDAQGGTVLVDADDVAGTDGGAAAVIFAPGPPLAGQTRSGGDSECSGDASNSWSAYLESGAFPANAMLTVKQGRRGDDSANDRLAWITPREIFTRIRQRSDFSAQTNGLLGRIRERLQTQGLPLPANALARGAKVVGDVPEGSLADDTLYKEWAQRWSDQLRYLVCSPLTACMNVNSLACGAVLVFSGERSGGGPRTSAQKADAASYFEGSVLAAVTGNATTLSGPPGYDAQTPAGDAIFCLKAP